MWRIYVLGGLAIVASAQVLALPALLFMIGYLGGLACAVWLAGSAWAVYALWGAVVELLALMVDAELDEMPDIWG